MTKSETVDDARDSLGRVGAFLPNIPFAAQPTLTQQRAAVHRLEQAGYPAGWVNEGVGGKDAFAQLAMLLAATERMTFAPAVMNMWARPPETAHGGASYLADGFPGRFVMGLGVGYRFQAETVGRDFDKPLAIARTYLDQMQNVPPITPALGAGYATILAANGPKMLDVARDHADGATPIMLPPEFTRIARDRLGPDKLLVIGLMVAVDEDRDQARARAREFVAGVLGVQGSPYAANLIRLGYAPAAVAEVTEDVVAAVSAFGTPADVAQRVQAHVDAGADHVRLGSVASSFDEGIDDLVRMAPAVLAS